MSSANLSANTPNSLVTLAVIGCGERGKTYANYALMYPDKCRVVAVAEPRSTARQYMIDLHKVDQSLVFKSWLDLHKASSETLKTIGKRLADAVIIATHDHMHAEVVLAFAEQGYHILCEKPMATSLDDCVKMTACVQKHGIIFGMGHVLRYSPYNYAIARIIESGKLGQLVNVVHVEPIGYYHFAHSYVRGNWAKENRSSFSLMCKSCHDIDIVCSWLLPAVPERVSSFGSLQHFKKSGKPALAGEATRCLDCACESKCPYSAKKIYLDKVKTGHQDWPVNIIVDGVPDAENVSRALKTGPYGLCVYESDNDVADHQVVNMQFSSGATCSFTMVAFTSQICERQSRLHFTHGEIVGDMTSFTVTDFRLPPNTQSTVYRPKSEGGGHGGGDLGLIQAFVEAVKTGRQDVLGTNLNEILRSHVTVFAAEKSRKEGKVINVEEFEKEVRVKLSMLGM